jgi:hypothetical protein
VHNTLTIDFFHVFIDDLVAVGGHKITTSDKTATGLKTVPLCSTKISLKLTHATYHGCISLKGCICWLGRYIIDNGSTWCRRDECRMGYARGRRTNKSCSR